MDDALTVSVVQRMGDLACKLDGDVHRQLDLAAEPVAQALPSHVGHRVPELASGLAGVEHGQDVWMLEPGRCADLAQETLGADA